MKKKDIIALVLLAIVLISVASLLISKVGRGDQPRTAEVEVVTPLDPTFSDEAKEILLGRHPRFQTKTYSAPLNLKQGFGNTDPFASP